MFPLHKIFACLGGVGIDRVDESHDDFDLRTGPADHPWRFEPGKKIDCHHPFSAAIEQAQPLLIAGPERFGSAVGRDGNPRGFLRRKRFDVDLIIDSLPEHLADAIFLPNVGNLGPSGAMAEPRGDAVLSGASGPLIHSRENGLPIDDFSSQWYDSLTKT